MTGEKRIRPVTVVGAGHILSLIISATARSRKEIAQKTGLSRATVTHRLDSLFKAGLILEATELHKSGGRPARAIQFNRGYGVTLVADIGETHIRAALTDLEPRILADETGTLDVGSGPEPVLNWISRQFHALLERAGRSADDLIGIGLCLPAPVDYGIGRVVGPSIMSGWDGFDISGFLRKDFDVPVVADNDVNIMTLAEHKRFWSGVDQALFVKAGTGIGSGIVMDGRIYRGAQGAAGDIGHIRLGGHGDPLCRCGNVGCVEAIAGGWALARDLRALGFEARDGRDVLALMQRNVPEAIHAIRNAGRILGEVIADSVSILNPSLIVVGGTLSRAGEHLLAGIRELVYQRSLPLATRQLVIAASQLDERAGIIGAAQLVFDTRFLPDVIEATIEGL